VPVRLNPPGRIAVVGCVRTRTVTRPGRRECQRLSGSWGTRPSAIGSGSNGPALAVPLAGGRWPAVTAMVTDRVPRRDREVLHALVEAHVDLGTPVGSRTLCARAGWRLSPATVRATLMRLEELGLVQQPHTSAGRVPTDRGYRLYVAQRLEAGGFGADAEDTRLREELERRLRDAHVEEILAQLAQALGEVSHQLGVVMAPRFERGVLQRLELVQLADNRILLIVMIRRGLTRSLVIPVDSQTGRAQTEAVSRRLNERLTGLTLAQIRGSVRERLLEPVGLQGRLLEAVTDQIEGLAAPRGAELHVGGASNICLQPEFSDPARMAALMGLVERRDALAHLLGSRQGMVITIGCEHSAAEMRLCAVITASYEARGASGVIGVIGPMRMPYGRVVNLVTCAAYRAAALVS
jgi:heat-inducible transcriptional repressor